MSTMTSLLLGMTTDPNRFIQGEEGRATVSVVANQSQMLRSNVKSIFSLFSLFFYSIERDAQLLANRIALLKQEEMKTWKKIEETKKRAKEVNDLKRRNEERI